MTGRAWQRLQRRQDFLGVAASGVKKATPGFVLQARRTSRPDLRVGFTASRKVGIAVMRNRAKRRLRAAVDRITPTIVLTGWDLVVVARQEAVTRDFAAMAGELARAVATVTKNDGTRRHD